jgi:antitoxin PrlF
MPVRTALRLVEGDELVYTIDGDRVVLTKASREPADDPFATFNEWASDDDRRGYAEL